MPNSSAPAKCIGAGRGPGQSALPDGSGPGWHGAVLRSWIFLAQPHAAAETCLDSPQGDMVSYI